MNHYQRAARLRMRAKFLHRFKPAERAPSPSKAVCECHPIGWRLLSPTRPDCRNVQCGTCFRVGHLSTKANLTFNRLIQQSRWREAVDLVSWESAS
jgi:hypothetical protein